MAFAATALSGYPNSFSIGPLKIQVFTFSAASADTSGTITATGLSSIVGVVVPGLTHTSAATFSGNVATLAFADPAATVYGTAIVIGR